MLRKEKNRILINVHDKLILEPQIKFYERSVKFEEDIYIYIFYSKDIFSLIPLRSMSLLLFIVVGA